MMKEKSGAGFPGEGNETVCWGPKRGIDSMRWTPEGTRSGGNLQLSTRGGIIFISLHGLLLHQGLRCEME
jgi:hypothetical protein